MSRRSFFISRINWPLWLGGLIVSLVFLLAVFGSALAPQDPMQENTIIKVGDDWETPPFSPLAVRGFPLGSDQFGRDLLSRMLWGVRPTLIMVAIVAVMRLVLGIVIGLGAGWSTGRLGRGLDAVISAALSVPVLIVALAAIAVVGVELGLLAFIIGLSITGWAATARLVREQTQLVKGNLYIEAARALGASDSNILFRHVLRQIMPMVWMLFSFEIGSTLMTTAGLGFLGYYIGGEVWVDVSDFVARRLSGMPELGQILASAWSEQQIITQPWAMIVAGSTIFVAVLGFTLLGEGLRLRLSLKRTRQRTAFSAIPDRVKAWAGEKGFLTDPQERKPGVFGNTGLLRLAVAAAVVVIVGGALLWWRVQGSVRFPVGQTESVQAVAGGHPWATERHDPQGTLWSGHLGPSDPVIEWVFQDSAGFAGGPAVSADGTIYVASSAGTLYALDSFGSVLWQMSLPAGAVGAPALSPEGKIYVADLDGGLSAFSSDGSLFWRYQPEGGGKATTGPIVAADGTIYYPGGGKLHAVSPEGDLLWTARAPYGFDPSPPLLSPTGGILFFLDAAFSIEDGSPYDLDALAGKASNEQYLIGANGKTYYRSQDKILEWVLNASGVEILQSLNKQVPGHPRDAGVTPDGITWATYGVGYNSPDSGIVWLDWNDQVLGNIEYEQMPNRIMGVGTDAVIYTCGNAVDGSVVCTAAKPGVEELLWQATLDQGGEVVGGALVPGGIYVSLDNGSFYAIGAASSEGKAVTSNGQPRIINANPSSELPTSTALALADDVDRAPTPRTNPEPVPTPTQSSREAARPGDTLTYTLSVVNNGPSGATGVTVTDTLPAGLRLLSAASSQGDGCDQVEDTIICQMGDLANGASATITVVVTVEMVTAETLANAAVVTSQVDDPDRSDNQIEQQTSVAAEADLAIHQFDRPDPVVAGTTLTYTLTVTNSGPADVAEVTIIDSLPAAAVLASASGTEGAICSAGQGKVVNCMLADLAQGASAWVAIVVRVAPSITGAITNTATVTATVIDPNLRDNSATESTSIRSEADLSINP